MAPRLALPAIAAGLIALAGCVPAAPGPSLPNQGPVGAVQPPPRLPEDLAGPLRGVPPDAVRGVRGLEAQALGPTPLR